MIWNVSVQKSEGTILGYQLEADTAREVVCEAELLYGKVIRVCLSDLDED